MEKGDETQMLVLGRGAQGWGGGAPTRPSWDTWHAPSHQCLLMPLCQGRRWLKYPLQGQELACPVGPRPNSMKYSP